jgi:hypothetical protein
MLAFIVWLPFEDTQIWSPLFLGAGAALWFGVIWIARHGWRNVIWVSASCGAVAPLLAITLMAVKSGLHAHGFADFTARLVVIAAILVPVGGGVGALVGLAMKKKGKMQS